MIMRTSSLVIVSLCIYTSVVSAAGLPRLAVLAEDTTTDSRNMADLMQAELSSREDVEMVERAEIDLALREQEISAAGFTDAATRVRLGRILKANGLVFVGPRTVRVVETSDGFLAGSLMHPQHDTTARAAAGLSAGVAGLLPKLTRNPELHTCVTILRFSTVMIGTAGAHEHEARFDAMMLERLTAGLCAEPDVLLMERRRTGDLMDEAGLAGERLRLKTGALIIDGVLASALQEAVDAANPSVVLTIRVRDLTGREIIPVVLRGSRSELGKLMEEGISQTIETVRHNLRTGAQDTLKSEVEALVSLAKTRGAIWPIEAAYALDPKNEKVRDEFIFRLFTGVDHPDSPTLSPGEANAAARLRYYGYARMEQIFRETRVSFQEHMYKVPLSNQMLRDLSAEESHADPELVMLLRPLRQALANALEGGYSAQMPPERKGELLTRMVIWARALAGTNRERQAIRRKIFDRVVSDPSIDDEARDIAMGYMLTHHHWKPDFLVEQSRSNDPLRRYYAHCRLMWWESDLKMKRFHANAAASEVDALLERRGAFGLSSLIFMPYHVDPKSLQAANHWFIFLARRICTILPEMKEPLARKVFERAKVLLAQKDYKAIELLEPHVTFSGVPEKEFLEWIDEVLKEAPPWSAKALFSELEKCAADIRPRVAPASPKTSSLKREVLFTVRDFEQKWKFQDPRWRYMPDNKDMAYEMSDMLPCRLLLDGGTLWVALGGQGSWRKGVPLHACGLVAIDAATKRIISGRFGWHECHTHNRSIMNITSGQITRDKQTHTYPIMPLARVRDFILVPHGDVGVGMFPVRGVNASDLRGVEWFDINRVPLSKPKNSQIRSIAHAGGTCYLCLDQTFILAWNPPAQTATVIFDATQKMAGLQMPDFVNRVEDMWADHATGKLIASGRHWEAAGMGLRSGKDMVFSIGFSPKTSEWALLDAIPERPDTTPPSQVMRKALATDADEFIADIAPIDDTSFFVLAGYGTKWRLEKVSMKNEN